jgi:hypothetical protein
LDDLVFEDIGESFMSDIKVNPVEEEVVVTREMEEAGFRVLANSGIVDECAESDKLLLAQIFRAMLASAPESRRKSRDDPST